MNCRQKNSNMEFLNSLGVIDFACSVHLERLIYLNWTHGTEYFIVCSYAGGVQSLVIRIPNLPVVQITPVSRKTGIPCSVPENITVRRVNSFRIFKNILTEPQFSEFFNELTNQTSIHTHRLVCYKMETRVENMTKMFWKRD